MEQGAKRVAARWLTRQRVVARWLQVAGQNSNPSSPSKPKPTGVKVRNAPVERQHKQKGKDKAETRQDYRKDKATILKERKLRYKKDKKKPAFKRMEQKRRDHPERFKRKT